MLAPPRWAVAQWRGWRIGVIVRLFARAFQMAVATRGSVTVGPFALFFTNVNRTMHLPGHSHFATLTLTFATVDGETHGFPAFGGTYGAIQRHLMALTDRPFHDKTNEDVANALWAAFVHWTDPEVTRWGGAFRLSRLELAVRGVPDRIGHADGFTTYTVEEGAP